MCVCRLAAALRALGLTCYSDELARIVDSREELPVGPLERAIRSVAVAAVDAAVDAANKAFTAFELSQYLQQLAEGELKEKMLPHLTRGTQAY